MVSFIYDFDYENENKLDLKFTLDSVSPKLQITFLKNFINLELKRFEFLNIEVDWLNLDMIKIQYKYFGLDAISYGIKAPENKKLFDKDNLSKELNALIQFNNKSTELFGKVSLRYYLTESKFTIYTTK